MCGCVLALFHVDISLLSGILCGKDKLECLLYININSLKCAYLLACIMCQVLFNISVIVLKSWWKEFHLHFYSLGNLRKFVTSHMGSKWKAKIWMNGLVSCCFSRHKFFSKSSICPWIQNVSTWQDDTSYSYKCKLWDYLVKEKPGLGVSLEVMSKWSQMRLIAHVGSKREGLAVDG